MELRDPCVITSRLLPGVRVGDAEISIETLGRGHNGRNGYRYYIDIPASDGRKAVSYENDDIQSGCQGGGVREGLTALLSFLGAFAESVGFERRTGRDSENGDLFPLSLRDWADANADEFAMLESWIEERPDCIVE